jgi:hypothetical protein
VRCLSVRQPWASLIVAGIKDVENRTWSTPHRGAILIHASQRPDLDADTRGRFTRAEIAALPRGGVVGLVTLVDCVTTSSSPWFDGPVGWLLRDAQTLPFYPCRGSLSLFDVTPEEPALRAVIDRCLLPLFSE